MLLIYVYIFVKFENENKACARSSDWISRLGNYCNFFWLTISLYFPLRGNAKRISAVQDMNEKCGWKDICLMLCVYFSSTQELP